MLRRTFIALAMLAGAAPAHARDIKVATWNLGWHLSQAEADAWAEKCGQPFALNSEGTAFVPAPTGTPGWELDWWRDAKVKPQWDISVWPPCNVFRLSGKNIPVTPAAYRARDAAIAKLLATTVNADVIAFQEVSGKEAVLEVLPNHGADYEVCSFTDHKVQRLAFAWKKTLAPTGTCTAEPAISLPKLPADKQVRPGFKLDLVIDGKPTRFLTVHLKSGCVTPLDSGLATTAPDARGHLEGTDESCTVLQQQIAPLEAWITEQAPTDGRMVLMGDFNRSLWFEAQAQGPVRTNGSPTDKDIPSDVKVINLLKEVNDQDPPQTALTLLHETCPASAKDKALCDDPRSVADPQQRKKLQQAMPSKDNLGCQHGVELDHILIGNGFSSGGAEKVPLGPQGVTLPASSKYPNPKLALSDHCPLVATLRD